MNCTCVPLIEWMLERVVQLCCLCRCPVMEGTVLVKYCVGKIVTQQSQLHFTMVIIIFRRLPRLGKAGVG